MDSLVKAALWQQFGAAIDMLDNAVVACPDELWGDRSRNPEFWYVTYHALFWLDLYLSGSVEHFSPPAPFNLGELEWGVFPERVYAKDELRAYLRHGRRKCQATIEALTDADVTRSLRFPSGMEMSFPELLLYNLRHVQEHAAQLSLILGQERGWEADWVSRARS
jgi:hypothetical protein